MKLLDVITTKFKKITVFFVFHLLFFVELLSFYTFSQNKLNARFNKPVMKCQTESWFHFFLVDSSFDGSGATFESCTV